MKIVNIEKANLHIFWTTWESSMKITRKMWLMIILKATKTFLSICLSILFIPWLQARGDLTATMDGHSISAKFYLCMFFGGRGQGGLPSLIIIKCVYLQKAYSFTPHIQCDMIQMQINIKTPLFCEKY